jgi:tyrosine-protein kinase Etk/Wzc
MSAPERSRTPSTFELVGLHEAATALRRSWFRLAVGASLGIAVGLAVAGVWPPRYRSEARLWVESDPMAQGLAGAPVSMRDRLQALQEQLTSDPTLVALEARLRSEGVADSQVLATSVRPDLGVQIRNAASQHVAVFAVSYASADPERAQHVVQALTEMLVEERRHERARRAAVLTDLLDDEIQQLGERLAESGRLLAATGRGSLGGESAPAPGVSERLRKRQSQLAALQRLSEQLAAGEARYTADHPNLIQTREELRRLRASLVAAVPPAGERPSQLADSALAREYEGSLKTYESLLARRVEAQLAQDLEGSDAPMSEIRVLRQASLPTRAEWPNVPLLAAGGGLAGLALAVLSVGWGLLRRPVFFEGERLAEASGLPLVASIPLLPDAGGSGPGVPDPDWVMVAAPRSRAAEGYRAFLPHLCASSGTPVIMVTSAVRGEGKSVTAANLAAGAALDAGLRTLLIDANLRRPRAHRMTGCTRGPGLAEIAEVDGEPGRLAQATAVPNLYVIPSGTPMANPLALLNDERTHKIIEAAQRDFQAVFLDVPDVLGQVDAQLLERWASLVLFVVRAASTPSPAVMLALGRLQKPVGLIVTGAEDETPESAEVDTASGDGDLGERSRRVRAGQSHDPRARATTP